MLNTFQMLKPCASKRGGYLVGANVYVDIGKPITYVKRVSKIDDIKRAAFSIREMIHRDHPHLSEFVSGTWAKGIQ